MSTINLGVSVIICTFNGRNRISSTIEHLQRQETGKELKWEVIVVDNASTDKTDEFVNAFWMNKNVTEFKVVRENNPGLINARIKGIREAKYGDISFIDDDNSPDRNWVTAVFQTFSMHPEIAACGGKNVPVFETTAPDWFPLLAQSFACGDQLSGGSGYIETLWGAGLCIRKSAWNHLIENGFKNHLAGRTQTDLLAGEDSEICLGLRLAGFKLWYNSDLTLKHFIPAIKLELNNVLTMTEGFGKSEVVLRVYRCLLNPTMHIRSNWFIEYLATSYYYMMSAFRSWRFALTPINKPHFHDKKILQFITTRKFIKGYLNYLFRLKSDYGLIQQEIGNLYFNLNKSGKQYETN